MGPKQAARNFRRSVLQGRRRRVGIAGRGARFTLNQLAEFAVRGSQTAMDGRRDPNWEVKCEYVHLRLRTVATESGIEAKQKTGKPPAFDLEIVPRHPIRTKIRLAVPSSRSNSAHCAPESGFCYDVASGVLRLWMAVAEKTDSSGVRPLPFFLQLTRLCKSLVRRPVHAHAESVCADSEDVLRSRDSRWQTYDPGDLIEECLRTDAQISWNRSRGFNLRVVSLLPCTQGVRRARRIRSN